MFKEIPSRPSVLTIAALAATLAGCPDRMEVGDVSCEDRNAELERQLVSVKAELAQVQQGTAKVEDDGTSDTPEVLLANFEQQHGKMAQALQRYEVSTNGMPSWEKVKQDITPEVLAKVAKMQQPTLILVPPVGAKDLVKSIDAHKISGQIDTFVWNLDDNNLWGNEENLYWDVQIVEGVEDIPRDPEIVAERLEDRKTNFEMTKAWLNKLKGKGLNVLSGARAYIALQMQALAEGRRIDPVFLTVLNVENLQPGALLAVGYWNFGRVGLVGHSPGDRGDSLRLRASVGVDVPKN